MKSTLVRLAAFFALLTISSSAYAAPSEKSEASEKVQTSIYAGQESEEATCLIFAMSSTGDGIQKSPQCDEYFKKYWKILCEDLKTKGYECRLEPRYLWELLLQVYDTNGNGEIDPDEMIAVIERLLDWGIVRGLVIDYLKKHGYPIDYDEFLRLIRNVLCKAVDNPEAIPLCNLSDDYSLCFTNAVAFCCKESGGRIDFDDGLSSCFPGNRDKYRHCFDVVIPGCSITN